MIDDARKGRQAGRRRDRQRGSEGTGEVVLVLSGLACYEVVTGCQVSTDGSKSVGERAAAAAAGR